MRYDIKTAAGARTRLVFRLFPEPEKTEVELHVHTDAGVQSFSPSAAEPASVLLPPLCAGRYLYDFCLSGQVLLHGELQVRPSALWGRCAEVLSVVTVDLPLVAFVLNPGPRGEIGAQGPQGLSAYELAARHGYDGSESDWVAELQGAQAAAAEAKLQAQGAAQAADSASGYASAAGTASTAAAAAAELAGVQANTATSAASTAKEYRTLSQEDAEAAATSAGAAAGSAKEAADSAIAATDSAESAATSASAAFQSATTAHQDAADAQSFASAADNSATAAADSATAAADTLAAAPKLNGNNTFEGTNTFNGVLAANGGITGLPQPTGASDAISRDGGFISAVFAEIQRARISPSLSKISGEAPVTTEGISARGKSLTSAQTAGITQATLFGSGDYHYFSAAWLEFKQNFANAGGRWRVVLDLSSQNLAYQTSDFSRPSLLVSSVDEKINRFAYVEITAEVHTAANGAAITLRGMNVQGTEFQGMREIRSALPYNATYSLTGSWNHQGIRGLFLQPTEAGCRVYLVPDSGSYRPFYIGTVQLNRQLYYPIRILLMAENTDLKLGDLSVWRGTVSDYATGIIGATTPELTTEDLTREQLEERYPES